MTAERARPLAALLLVSLLCALVVSLGRLGGDGGEAASHRAAAQPVTARVAAQVVVPGSELSRRPPSSRSLPAAVPAVAPTPAPAPAPVTAPARAVPAVRHVPPVRSARTTPPVRGHRPGAGPDRTGHRHGPGHRAHGHGHGHGHGYGHAGHPRSA
jgi:hypothetical protein